MAPLRRRPAAVRPASALRSPTPETPPGRHHGQRRRLQQRLQSGEVGPRQHAVARHGRRHHGADGLLLPQLEQIGHGAARPGQPPLRLRLGHPVLADAVVEPDGDPSRPAAGTAARQRGLLEGGGAQDHPRHAGVEDLGGIVLGADAAAELHADAGGAGQADDPGQHVTLVRHARAGPVEVDDVDPTRAAGDVARGEGRRVAVTLLAPEVALGEPDRRAGAQVDGRQQLHHAACSARRTKLARSVRPVDPDFSGWNCAPHRVPRVASAATSPP